MTRHFAAFCILVIFPLCGRCDGVGVDGGFKRRVGGVTQQVVWEASEIVAVGELRRVRLLRVEAPEGGGVPAYWCRGEFHVRAVLKGKIGGKVMPYVWGTSYPGCVVWNLRDRDAARFFARLKTKAWMTREEGGVLRPTYDSGSTKFIGLFVAWESQPGVDPAERFAGLLLTPEANSDDLETYSRYLWDVGDIACSILGKARCLERLRELAGSGNPGLSREACGFMGGQLGRPCK